MVRLVEIIDDEGFEDKLILVMEHCPGGQILNWSPETHEFSANERSEHIDASGHVSEATIKKVILQAAKGIQFCHELGVLHRDIKP